MFREFDRLTRVGTPDFHPHEIHFSLSRALQSAGTITRGKDAAGFWMEMTKRGVPLDEAKQGRISRTCFFGLHKIEGSDRT